MSYFNKFKIWKFSKNRTEAFSDGVFAIVITLLILEIKVPHLENHNSSEELIHQLGLILPKIISWVVSFFFVAVMWLHHHNVLRMADKIDYGVVWINNIFLMMVCFFPFPTALMGEYPHNRFAVLLFGVAATMASLMQNFFYGYIARNCLQPGYNKTSVLKNVRLSFILAPVLLIIAVPLSFVNLWLPYLVYAIVPFFFLLPMDKDE